MSGANTDVVTRLAEEFNASQDEYRIVPTYKGQLRRHPESWARRG
jgi:sn-glycerol 3-phosphate transport system substrate-binding protein